MTTTPKVQKVINDRRDYAADTHKVYCGDCWEEVEFFRELSGVIVKGRSTGWRHARTGKFECEPICDCCGVAPATRALSRQEWNGHTMRWENRAFVCKECEDRYSILIISTRT